MDGCPPQSPAERIQAKLMDTEEDTEQPSSQTEWNQEPEGKGTRKMEDTRQRQQPNWEDTAKARKRRQETCQEEEPD